MIPPIIIANKVITNLREQAIILTIFNNFFASKCMSIVNDNILPSIIMYRTENRLSTISFKDEDVLKIIKSLNINKAHGHDAYAVQCSHKQCMVNYRPVSFLPICGKIFERFIFNPVFEFREENKLLSPNQSDF